MAKILKELRAKVRAMERAASSEDETAFAVAKDEAMDALEEAEEAIALAVAKASEEAKAESEEAEDKEEEEFPPKKKEAKKAKDEEEEMDDEDKDEKMDEEEDEGKKSKKSKKASIEEADGGKKNSIPEMKKDLAEITKPPNEEHADEESAAKCSCGGKGTCDACKAKKADAKKASVESDDLLSFASELVTSSVSVGMVPADRGPGKVIELYRAGESGCKIFLSNLKDYIETHKDEKGNLQTARLKTGPTDEVHKAGKEGDQAFLGMFMRR